MLRSTLVLAIVFAGSSIATAQVQTFALAGTVDPDYLNIEPNPAACGLTELIGGAEVRFRFSYDESVQSLNPMADHTQYLDALTSFSIDVANGGYSRMITPTDSLLDGYVDGTEQLIVFEAFDSYGDFWGFEFRAPNGVSGFMPDDLGSYAELITNFESSYGVTFGSAGGTSCFVEFGFFLETVVPEPSGFELVFAALGLLAYSQRR